MGMNIDNVKKRLNELKNATTKQNNLWKPQPGKTVIRIVPYKYNSSFIKNSPFIELYFHFDMAKKPILSPVTFGEPDPIVEFAEKLKKAGPKEDWKLGKKLEPKMRVYVPVIVRGEEKSGVKFWGFGKQVYEQLLNAASDPEYGDISDTITGSDITVEFTSAKDAGKDYPVTTIMIKRSASKLSDESTVVERLLNEQKDITEIYKKPTYKELVDVLEKWMNPETQDTPEETPSSEEGVEEPVDDKTPEIDTNTKQSTPQKVAGAEGVDDVSKAFDDLFEKATQAKK